MRQVAELKDHYAATLRIEAIRNLETALDEASERITFRPMSGLPAPRPYPLLARPGRAWIKSKRYWIAYSLKHPPVIIGVFFETANIPKRC